MSHPDDRSPSWPPSRFRGVVALDGPSGTGKSTVARRLAERLGARYLDTGAMYRAATLAVLRRGIELEDAEAVLAVVRDVEIRVATDPFAPAAWLDGERVDGPIRSAEVTGAVSAVSAVAPVREILVGSQREIIGAGGIVVEGRDIGSVVWPQARPKVYLTASEATRAARRAGELGGRPDGPGSDGPDSERPGSERGGPGVLDPGAVAADLARRDRLDSTRAASPLVQAADAVTLDTTDLDIDQVVQQLVDMTIRSGTPASGGTMGA